MTVRRRDSIVSTSSASLSAPTPPNGTITDRLTAHGISWLNYYSDLPAMAVIPAAVTGANSGRIVKVSQFITDAAAGKPPPVSFVDPNFDTQSEENPQDIRQGERFAAAIINAAMQGPGWSKTMLIWFFDEHGGYYDHVPPPQVDAFGLGFRVPCLVVSPFVKKGVVQHEVREFSSIARFCEGIYGLPALSTRDAAGDDFMSAFDFAQSRPYSDFVPAGP